MTSDVKVHPEVIRLQEVEDRTRNWKRWGPYLAERQWGTVREDYSPDGSCWDYFTHDQSRSRTYRWGEDGLLGFTDRQCRLCFALALWNGEDTILKERLFGVTGSEGNHAEDVKEYYHYLTALPTFSYFTSLYRYPHARYPYRLLVTESKKRTEADPEFELADTGIFKDNAYFDIYAEYAKTSANDICIRIRAINRGAAPRPLWILPQLWFRNTWSWGRRGEGYTSRPQMRLEGNDTIVVSHASLGGFRLVIDRADQKITPLFCENETNFERLFNEKSGFPYVKDAFHRYVVEREETAVNPDCTGTKSAFMTHYSVPSGAEIELRLRLTRDGEPVDELFGESFNRVFEERRQEHDSFYDELLPEPLIDDDRRIGSQAYAGLLHTRQFYYYCVQEWLDGDPTQPTPAKTRRKVRNTEWKHLYNRDIISMPDKWEYPWYAAWDLAFHMLPMCRVDAAFAKEQLLLLLREWYMHPNGQMPAYEFAFSDVNPPVHAWACWRVYKMEAAQGKRDLQFLARAFHKLLLNFTWWVNQKDTQGNNLFSGGFLGLDNIGIFNRSNPLPYENSFLEQADGTAWMAFYCGTMLSIALELAIHDRSYEDVATKFFEHFIAISDALNYFSGSGLWDEQDGFYYDQLHIGDESTLLRIRSLVGLIPMCAVEVFTTDLIESLQEFRKRVVWFIKHRPDLASYISYLVRGEGASGRTLLALPSRHRLLRILEVMLDEDEFLSPFGIRSLSRVHLHSPYYLEVSDEKFWISYTPGESTTRLFGGNSNWRGPVWFPVNYLIIEALERYHHFYGDAIKVECPTGSGNYMNLKQVSLELCRRLVSIFQKDQNGYRPYYGNDVGPGHPLWSEDLMFFEYFHGDTGKGLGASHQTGWTALVVMCMEKLQRAGAL